VPSVIPNLAYHVPILMYHRIVTDDRAGQVLNHLLVTPANFEAQMSALADRGWHTITVGELADDMRNGIKVPAKTFVLTFDDGWWDGYTFAFPIMREHGFVGTFFVISSRIGASYTLTPDQMLELESAGNEIGDHSVSHYALAGHAYTVVYNQICQAADAIAAVTGHRPASLAYPIGPYDATTEKAAAACPGIEIALTTDYGAAESWKTRFATPRVRVNRSTSAASLLAALGA
jgi:peptidoglycan/xylan/chitin deacetylase (PgdA/CDA1 family)